jgi:hypothetical protein
MFDPAKIDHRFRTNSDRTNSSLFPIPYSRL